MHPEVTSDIKGSCPKCGMALVQYSTAKSQRHHQEGKGLGGTTWKSYQPLAVILSLIVLCAAIVSLESQRPLYSFLLATMTGFFLVFAGFKLIDLKGFAQGYSTYDLLAQRWFGYGYIYPFIELGFGLLMLAGYHPDWLLWSEAGLMSFSGLGVALKLAKRERFTCACLGTFLKVPLTYVTLLENFGMAAIALLLLFLR